MKKRMMSMLSLILAVIMLVGVLAGCGKGNTDSTNGTGDAASNADAVKVSVLVPSDFEGHITKAFEVF